jgi:hypothetical protein
MIWGSGGSLRRPAPVGVQSWDRVNGGRWLSVKLGAVDVGKQLKGVAAMAYWILQANPVRYRVAEALAEASSVRTWTVARYRRAIVPGDRFALWVSGARGGVYAVGSVTAAADFIPGDDRYWVNPAEAERPAWRVGISIEEVLPRARRCAPLSVSQKRADGR